MICPYVILVTSYINANSGQEVTLEAATVRIHKIEYQNPDLINGVLIFLTRRGRINHGIFKESQVSLFHIILLRGKLI